MPFDRVEEPLSSPDAFRQRGDAATLSAAAVLLALGFRLRGDEHAVAARASDVPDEPRPAIALPKDDAERLAIPPVRATGVRVDPSEAQSELARVKDAGGAAESLHRDPTPMAAAALFEACLQHPEELVRVAASSSYLDLATDPARPLGVLRQALANDDRLTRQVAATSLARFVPEDSGLARLLVRGQLPEGGPPSTTCILVHGTFGRKSHWWQPRGDFYDYFVAEVRNDVYSASDRFSWSGGYSDAARAAGGLSLRQWVIDHGLDGLDVFAHSHGGSVAMLATQGGGGLGIAKLVLLSCPVHIPKYLPNNAKVGSIVSVHVHTDLVILADGGGQKFNLPQIDEHVLPVWFDHFATHDPSVWEDYNVAQWV
jgi:hypothetical protein